MISAEIRETKSKTKAIEIVRKWNRTRKLEKTEKKIVENLQSFPSFILRAVCGHLNI
jgi:hypothetical protein